MIEANATTIVPTPMFTSAKPLFCATKAPPRPIKPFAIIKPRIVILSVLIPNERAIFGLSPVTIKDCPSSVFKKRAKKMVNNTITINPITITGKLRGKTCKKS